LRNKSVIVKSIVGTICIMILPWIGLRAQPGELLVKSNDKGLYIEHKVAPKENFYSVGRLFYVHPKHLAAFNSLDMTKGLNIGQVLKIPLTDTNFNQKTEKGLPVYYVTGNSESLYRVSTKNRNVLMEKLRQWNHLSDDNIAAGSKLVVGYLVSNESAATAFANLNKIETGKTVDAQSTNKEVATVETTVKEEPKKEEIKKEEQPKNSQVVQVTEELKPSPGNVSRQNAEQGYFRDFFRQQISQQPISKEQTVTSGIFKTASGWSDSKYYLLMDGIEPGTIVKITNPSNNRIIYAKLLGDMNGLKENQGLNIRISNAAASALDIAETDKFIVKLNY